MAVILALIPPASARADNWALLIGIDRYEDQGRINALGGAAADARSLKAALVEAANFPDANIRLLVSDGDVKPTRSNILTELARLAQNAAPGDTVFVLYGGHGMEVAGVPYLLPYDTTAFDAESLADSALPVGKFRQRLAQIKARALVLAFDMCRSSPLKTGKTAVSSDNNMTRSVARGLDFKKSAAATGDSPAASLVAATFYSCGPDERSYEWTEKGRGYFSYYLEQGLRGKAADAGGRVTLASLATYVSREVHKAVRLGEQKDQTPYPSLDGPGADGFVLTTGTPVSVTPPPDEPVAATPIDGKARLAVTANASDATVTVAGKVAENGVFVADLAAEVEKDVDVKVTAPGYEGQLMSVTLLRGRTVNLPVTLERVVAPPPSGHAPVIAPLAPTAPPMTLAEYKEQMVTILEGEFYRGENGGREDMKPAHRVYLAEYRIGKTDVTVAMFEEYCQATKRAMPPAPPFNDGWQNKDHPIVNVTWGEARDYCRWAGLRLPSEAQWEKAARGVDGRIYPWGNGWNTRNLRLGSGRRADVGTRAVGSYPAGASPYGVLDMAGNAWQWCEDVYDAGFYRRQRASSPNPVSAGGGDFRSLRGGSWYENNPTYFRATYRGKVAPATRYNGYGFRAVSPGY